MRRGPPALLRPFDHAMNTVEFFIHVEDVRRAQPDWEPRPLPPSLADALWSGWAPAGWPRQVGATVEITSYGSGTKVAGRGPVVVVDGDPGELTLFGAGRQAAARVEVTGDARLADRLRQASLGI